MLEPYDEDTMLRLEHVGGEPIEIDLRPFAVTSEPTVVWTSDDDSVRVLAVAVHHDPLEQRTRGAHLFIALGADDADEEPSTIRHGVQTTDP